MTKKDIVERVAREAGIEPKLAEEAVDSFLGVVLDSLVQTHKFTLRNFGSFSVRDEKGKPIAVFKSSKNMFPESF